MAKCSHQAINYRHGQNEPSSRQYQQRQEYGCTTKIFGALRQQMRVQTNSVNCCLNAGIEQLDDKNE